MITLNKHVIQPTIFPDGTSQVWNVPGLEILKWNSFVFVEWDFQSEAEFLHLKQLVDLLKYKGFQVMLYIPFLPYGRQDKSISNESTFALKSFMDLLGTLECREIKVLDAHNPKALIENVINRKPIQQILYALMNVNPDLIVYPDGGAQKRYSNLEMLQEFPSVSFTKKRNQVSGDISDIRLNDLEIVKEKICLIIDDICDGGATFIKCAEQLVKAGAKEVNLYTTHGIYSKGLEILKKAGIKTILNRKGLANE